MFFSQEKASLEQKTTGGIYCLCSNVSPDPAEHSGLKISFLIKLVGFLRQAQVQVIALEREKETFPSIFLFPVKPGLLALPQAVLLHASPLGQFLCPLVNGVCTKSGIWRMVWMHPQGPALGHGAAAPWCKTTLEAAPCLSWGSPCRTL